MGGRQGCKAAHLHVAPRVQLAVCNQQGARRDEGQRVRRIKQLQQACGGRGQCSGVIAAPCQAWSPVEQHITQSHFLRSASSSALSQPATRQRTGDPAHQAGAGSTPR